MNDESKTLPLSKSEIIIKSDWLTTVGAVLGGIAYSLLLVSEIRHFVWGHFVPPGPVRRDLFGIINEVYRVFACILAFVLAFEFRKKSLKVGCILGGLSLAASSLLSFLHMSPRTFHTVAMVRSVVWQVVLVLFLVAIVQWLRSVVRKAPTEPAGGAS
jgi:heme/copper-type cytochrome/quinol oxidase subunit 4